ncbi:Type-1A pilin [Ewingella americana]|jgi:major type 1 subunit fimbrin (pilin)|uniref:Fimbrial family protein n=2 Tax=Ewingella americana TaxID=41202 RepID=A0A085GFN2_EWIA3|nr:fimbrial family protein [Ewingella americana ATCC 33852]STQ44957.1 Type-1A pilin [Ewingella americana]
MNCLAFYLNDSGVYLRGGTSTEQSKGMADGFAKNNANANDGVLKACVLRKLKMKRNITGLALLVASIVSTSAFAIDGTINFKGNVISNPCTVSAASKSLDVQLGKISATSFPTSGSLSAAQKFTLVLSGCPTTVTSAKVRFDGNQVSGDNSILAVTSGTGKAGGIGIKIYDRNDNPVSLYQDSAAYPLTTAANNLEFKARYVSLANTVTPGAADGAAQFTIIYQ